MRFDDQRNIQGLFGVTMQKRIIKVSRTNKYCLIPPGYINGADKSKWVLGEIKGNNVKRGSFKNCCTMGICLTVESDIIPSLNKLGLRVGFLLIPGERLTFEGFRNSVAYLE